MEDTKPDMETSWAETRRKKRQKHLEMLNRYVEFISAEAKESSIHEVERVMYMAFSLMPYYAPPVDSPRDL